MFLYQDFLIRLGVHASCYNKFRPAIIRSPSIFNQSSINAIQSCLHAIYQSASAFLHRSIARQFFGSLSFCHCANPCPIIQSSCPCIQSTSCTQRSCRYEFYHNRSSTAQVVIFRSCVAAVQSIISRCRQSFFFLARSIHQII